MAEIIPAILPSNYEDLKNKVALIRGIVPVAQVDICDGIFTKSMTWPFSSPGEATDDHFHGILNEREGLPFWEDVDFELDLMVRDAVENFDIYMKLGPRRIIFHLEAVGDLEEFKHFLEGLDNYVRDVVEIGVAMNPVTPLEQIFPIISCVDFIQVMGNDEIGYSGVKLDEKVYEKIKNLKEKYHDLSIAVDIGVNDKTATQLIEAGATKIVIGSAIFNTDDIINAIENFKNL